MILFAAEIATETGYFVLVDQSEDTLFERVDALRVFLDPDDPDDSDDCDLAFGTVECDDIHDIDGAIYRIHTGQWSYSQRV